MSRITPELIPNEEIQMKAYGQDPANKLQEFDIQSTDAIYKSSGLEAKKKPLRPTTAAWPEELSLTKALKECISDWASETTCENLISVNNQNLFIRIKTWIAFKVMVSL
jgi:hypothetical protein